MLLFRVILVKLEDVVDVVVVVVVAVVAVGVGDDAVPTVIDVPGPEGDALSALCIAKRCRALLAADGITMS